MTSLLRSNSTPSSLNLHRGKQILTDPWSNEIPGGDSNKGGGESSRKGIRCQLPCAGNAKVQLGASDQYYLLRLHVELTFTEHLLGVRRSHTRDSRRIWPPCRALVGDVFSSCCWAQAWPFSRPLRLLTPTGSGMSKGCDLCPEIGHFPGVADTFYTSQVNLQET